jgi:hypothetical protein
MSAFVSARDRGLLSRLFAQGCQMLDDFVETRRPRRRISSSLTSGWTVYVIHRQGSYSARRPIGVRHWTFGRLAGFEALHYDGSSNAVTRR